MITVDKMKDVLVQYQGSGYDGCIWEWNFAYINNDGNFCNIFSSGVMGVDNKEDLQKNINNANTSEVFIYNLSKKEDREEFVKENIGSIVLSVIKKLEVLRKEKMSCFCAECGNELCVDDAISVNLECQGNIFIIYNDIVCINCYKNLLINIKGV